jgi:hypothetical protein
MKPSDEGEARECHQAKQSRLAPHLRIVEVDFLKPSNRNDRLEKKGRNASSAEGRLTE